MYTRHNWLSLGFPVTETSLDVTFKLITVITEIMLNSFSKPSSSSTTSIFFSSHCYVPFYCLFIFNYTKKYNLFVRLL